MRRLASSFIRQDARIPSNDKQPDRPRGAQPWWRSDQDGDYPDCGRERDCGNAPRYSRSSLQLVLIRGFHRVHLPLKSKKATATPTAKKAPTRMGKGNVPKNWNAMSEFTLVHILPVGGRNAIAVNSAQLAWTSEALADRHARHALGTEILLPKRPTRQHLPPTSQARFSQGKYRGGTNWSSKLGVKGLACARNGC
jgi:hypothetical protein